MPRMIELVRKSQMSATMMQAAARGALMVQPGEMMEILVHLALHHKVFGQQARMTLAGWDEKASQGVAADPATSTEVLGYLVSPKNIRPVLLPALLENPAVDQEALLEMAATGARWVVEALLASASAKKSAALMSALRTNPRLSQTELAALENPGEAVTTSEPAAAAADVAIAEVATATAPLGDSQAASAPVPVGDAESVDDEVMAQAIEHFLRENQAELAAEAHQPYQPVRWLDEGPVSEGGSETLAHSEAPEASAASAEPSAAKPSAAATAKPSAAAGVKQVRKPGHPSGEERRDSTLQKIARLDIKGRIALAMRGSKEERSLLIRDGTKLVALAVLDSPKISDGEVENFAQQKNVLEAVLRGIPLKRRFAKNYAITRNLVYNPRTPLDLSLGLMKNLLVHDLKNLSGNKEVSDTIRKLALRMFKQKSEKRKE